MRVMEIDVTQTADKSENASNFDEVVATEGNFSDTNNVTDSNHDKDLGKHANTQNKKCIKHALRQQARRRKKNTTIASGNTTTMPRIIVKPLPPQPTEEMSPVPTQKTPTMKEVLASIPGFSIKPRKRSNKKLSTAAQLEQTKEGCIDLETPDSILVNTNLRGLLNKYTFAALPPLYQQKLVQLLPSVDRQVITNSSDAGIRLSTSGLNNEFFARACLEWQERLAEGEFTPENQQKLKSEADKERSRLDPWKLKHFEPIWGDRSLADSDNSTVNTQVNQRPPIKTTIKLRPAASVSNKQKPAPLIKRLRTVGAVTRSCSSYKEELNNQIETNTKSPIPDLLPIKIHKSNKVEPNPVQSKKPDSNIQPSVDIPISDPCGTSKLEKRPEITIINLSDTIINTNQETIISCRDSTNASNVTEKRRRSPSADSEQKSPKRRTPSPVQIEKPVELEIEVLLKNPSELVECRYENKSDVSEQQDNESNTTETLSQLDLEDASKNLEEEHESPSATPAAEENLEVDNCDTKMSYELESTINKDDLKPAVDSKKDDSESFSDNITEESEDAKSVETENYNSASTEYDSPDQQANDSNESKDEHKEDSDEKKYEEEPMEISKESISEENTQEQTEIDEPFEILPNSLILQQESIIQTCSKSKDEILPEECAEKLEASVEESDLVISQITETNFERVRNVSDEDEANEDRFLDAETYVLESGQITLSTSQKNEKDEEIQATLFASARGTFCFCISRQIIY